MTHKYKVGDKVRVVANESMHMFRIGEVVTVTNVKDAGQWLDAEGSSGDEWALDIEEVEPYTTNNLTLNTTYTAMNGSRWTCIHLRDNGNAVLDNGISSAEYTSEGKRVDGDSRYDVRLEDDVEEVTWRCSRSGKGLPQYNTLFDVTLNLINGQPDWSSAKVEGV